MPPATFQPAGTTITVRGIRPLHVPDVDEYTGAPTEMGAAKAPARFDAAVQESVDALPERIAELIVLCSRRNGFPAITNDSALRGVRQLLSRIERGEH